MGQVQVAITERAAKAKAADAAPAVAENPKVARMAVKPTHLKVGLDHNNNNNSSSSVSPILLAPGVYQEMEHTTQTIATLQSSVSSTITSVIGLRIAETHQLRGRVIIIVMLMI